MKRGDKKIVLNPEHAMLSGARLLELRRGKGWTIQRLATEAGVNPSTVWRWETGRVPISVAMSRLLRQLLTLTTARRTA